LKFPKNWAIPKIDFADALRISEMLNVSMLCAKILCARGFGYDDAKKFLKADCDTFHNPFLLNDMQKAVDRINLALDSKEKIAVYGDYDVDGITATYILYDYLSNLSADVVYYIPDRTTEGYGINKGAIDNLKKMGVSLIITVDAGITATEEIDYSNSVGVDVIVTDHHALKETLPDAIAVINPKIADASYPFDSLAGVGVAFKLIYAHSGMDNDIFLKYCDIVAIGTIADMVPLRDENRYITAIGIKKLQHTDNIGVKALIEVAGLKPDTISSTDVSFSIAPRLNAAGRMSHAEISVELLLEKNQKNALERARDLDSCNRERQNEEQKIFFEAMEIIENNNLDKNDFIVVAQSGWAHGVIGIVSSKITDKFYKPSAVISINDDGTGKASGRSIKGINLFDALNDCSEHLVRFGGHELAAGFTVECNKLDEFSHSISEYVRNHLTTDISVPTIDIDCEIEPEDITLAEIESLRILEPYGIDNRTPVFCINDLRVESVRYTQNRKHAFLTVSKNGIKYEFPAFSMADDMKDFSKGDFVSVAGTLGINSFRGVTSAQFVIRDIRYSELSKKVTESELRTIFIGLRSVFSDNTCTVKKSDCIHLDNHTKLKIKSPKFSTALTIFKELEIISFQETESGYVIQKGSNFSVKINLTDSDTYRKYGF